MLEEKMKNKTKTIFTIFIVFILIIITIGYEKTVKEQEKLIINTGSLSNIDSMSGISITPIEQTGSIDKEPLITASTYSNIEYGFTMKYTDNFFDDNHLPSLITGECNTKDFPNKCPNISKIITDLPENTKGINEDAQKVTINDVTYCLSNYQDAATGHVYTYDYYTTIKNNKCLIIPIVTQKTNCDFYLPLEEGNAQQKIDYDNCVEKNKNQPLILNKIISTFKFTK